MNKTTMYLIKMGGKYLQGIEPNKHYAKNGVAPTMGARHCYHEFVSIWGADPKPFERLTASNYIKIIFEEFRWEERKPAEIKIIPVEV